MIQADYSFEDKKKFGNFLLAKIFDLTYYLTSLNAF